MSQRLADAFQRTAQRTVTQGAASWQLATITAAYTDGTCDITTATGPVERVRRLSSYANPLVGDRVHVVTRPDGNWLITGATAADADGWQALTMAAGFTPAGGATDGPPSARRTQDGVTILAGVLSGTLTTSGETAMCTIPSSCRPIYKGNCLVVGSTSIIRILIPPTGAVTGRVVSGAVPSWISLDNVVCR
ncbi:hypothetical protein ACIP88_05010 [Streptomyces uncialis]|uniref:hypothetical protein n=1 Tax=Streptomyces uncialis TaxID=1048205 RepID=UPI003811A9B4